MSVYLRVVQHVQYISSPRERSMTIESYLLPLTRMMSRRGKIDVNWSDNSNRLKTLSKSSANAGRYLQPLHTGKGPGYGYIRWNFISPRTSYWGGFYERLVKLVKTPLKKTLVKAMLTDRRRNEDNTYSSRGTNKQSSLEALRRRESHPLPLTPAVIIIGKTA